MASLGPGTKFVLVVGIVIAVVIALIFSPGWIQDIHDTAVDVAESTPADIYNTNYNINYEFDYSNSNLTEYTYDYIIFVDTDEGAPSYFAKNGTTGIIDSYGTNASVVVQYAIDNGDSLFFKSGIYEIPSTIYLDSDSKLVGEHPKLLWDGGSIEECFNAEGRYGDNESLTLSVYKGQNYAIVADDSLFYIGETVFLRSSLVPSGGVAKYAQFLTVVEKNSGNISFAESIKQDYLTSNSAEISKINFIENISFSGIDIYGADSTSLYIDGVYLYLCRNVYFDDSSIQECGRRGIIIHSCYNTEINNCKLINISHTHYGYAIAIVDASTILKIHNNYFNANSKHIIGNDIEYGYPSSIDIYENLFINAKEVAINWEIRTGNNVRVYSNDFYLWKDICVVVGGEESCSVFDNVMDGGGSGDHAIKSGQYVDIISIYKNQIFRCDDISIDITSGKSSSISIESNHFINCKSTLISVIPAINHEYNIYIKSNNINGNTLNKDGIVVRNSPYIEITGNVIKNISYAGIDITSAKEGIIGWNSISNCGRNSTSTGSSEGIYMYSSSNITIIGNRLFDDQDTPTQRYGYYETSSAGGCRNMTIIYNIFDGNTVSALFSQYNIPKLNIGFITENSGTGTTSGGSLVVSHGLDYTPTIDEFSINLGSNSTYWIDTITTTQFTIHTSASAVNFGWAIRRV